MLIEAGTGAPQGGATAPSTSRVSEPVIERRRVDRRAIRRTSEVDVRPVPDIGGRPPASVVVIDDHTLLGDTIVGTLRREGFVSHTVAPTSRGAVLEAVAALGSTVALLDLDLGSAEFDGLDLIEPLLDLGVDVVALLSVQEPLLAAASIDAGAKAVISKSEPFSVMLEAVRSAARGQLTADAAERDDLRRLLRQQRRAHAERLAPFQQLTPRERDVLSHLMDGRSAEGIAAASYVSLATVRSQIRAVLMKLGVNSQLGAVAAARACGWVGHEEMPMATFSSTLRL